MADYDRPHIDISALRSTETYAGQQRPITRDFVRVREQHGERLGNEFAVAIQASEGRRPLPEDLPDGVPPATGNFIAVEIARAAGHVDVERSKEGTRQSAEKPAADGGREIVLYIPDVETQDKLRTTIDNYRSGELTDKGNPPLAGRIEPIQAFRAATLESFWRDDPARLPTEDAPAQWWGIWCWPDCTDDVCDLSQAIGATVAPDSRWSRFPEAWVIPIHTTRACIQRMIDIGHPGIAEIGQATDDAAVIIELPQIDHDYLVGDLATRIQWPGSDVPSVCILDTGVNRAHPLIEPALAPNDTQAVEDIWGSDDHHRPGHGTCMAGLALHNDLTGKLADVSQHELRHRLESVKILPPGGHPPNDPRNYGAITEAAVAKAEIMQPDRSRVICMAVTNENHPGDRPTRWSAAVDKICAGVDGNDEDQPPRRLFVQSIGNIAHDNDWLTISIPDNFMGEDPSQAWNALSVGGVTFRSNISEAGYDTWTACAGVGGHSPYSRTSTGWPEGSSPVKPELVFEAGNRATNQHQNDVADGMPSLSLITTGRGGSNDSLLPFWATSAATAQAAKMSAQIMAEHPAYWPETVRALMVHSASWTEPMKQAISETTTKTELKALRRRFGYGMPSLGRALASASNDLALVAEAYIQPYDKPERSRTTGQRIGSVKYGEAHYYDLPWPARVLEELENTPVKLKITLSYFIEPSPMAIAMLDPSRYRSFGLRFDMKRTRETEARFRSRTNAALEGPVGGAEDDDGWLFGPRSVAAGSLHVDVWSGTAVELAARDKLCIYPVMGWWRERPGQNRFLEKARYSLVVTLEAPEVDIDLQVQIQATLDAMIRTQAEIEIGEG